MPEGRVARQFWIQRPGHGTIVTTELPSRQAGEVVVRALYSGISRGTESLVFRGEVPPSQFHAMRAPFQEGEFPGPVKYGYASVGIVEEVGEEAAEEVANLVGRSVFCLHPHQDRYCVPADAVAPLPDGVPPGRAVLAANLETAINGLWDARPSAGDRVVVIGAGVVGLLVAWLCRQIPGAEVTVVDVNPSKAVAAEGLGLMFASESPVEPEADLVVHASGQPEGLASALTVAGLEATILEMSWYGSRIVPVPLGEAFHARRLTLKSSQVGRVPADRASRWSRARRLRLALHLLTDERLDVLINDESDFERLPEVLAGLSAAPSETLCHRVRYVPQGDPLG